jgi:cell volume regulation protein A
VLRQSLHPLKLGVAIVVTVTILAALGPLTPGLVLPQGWRLALAVILGMTAAVIAHGLLQRAPPSADDDRLRALRPVFATAALLLAGTVILSFLLAVVTDSTEPVAGDALGAGLRIDRPLWLGAGLLTAGVLAAALGTRLRVPGALLFIGIGMVIGDDGLGWVSLTDPVLVQSLGVAALVIILFEGGLTTDVQQLRRAAAPGLVLATVGVVVTTGITAAGAVWLLDMPARVAWLVGAIVASTDAAAVFDLLRRAPLPERLASVLKVESGVNDPVAVLLTVGLLSVWQTAPTAYAWLVFGALQLIGGAAVGAAVGWIGSYVLRRVRLDAGGLYPVLGLALAGIAYGTSAAVGGSGFLATFVTGVVLASEVPRRRWALRSFHMALANGVEIGLFLLLGLLVFPSQLPGVALTALGVVALLALVARPLACAVSLAPMGFSMHGIAAVSWLGMRGAVPIVLATFALSAGISDASTIFDVVFFIVLTSLLVQGTTAVGVIRLLGLHAERSPRDVIAEVLPIERTAIDMVEVVVHEDSALVGQVLREATAPESALVTAIVRGNQIVLPRGDTRIQPGDLLVVTTTDRTHGIQRIEEWAQATDPHSPAR